MPKKSKSPWGDNPYYMAGTEGTGEYVVIAYNDTARVGFRVISDSHVRIRIEPASAEAIEMLREHFPGDAWKQPDSHQQRFSLVVSGGDKAIPELERALKVVQQLGSRLQRKTGNRLWRRKLSKLQSPPLHGYDLDSYDAHAW